MAGLSFQAIAELTVADIEVAEGVATIRTPGGSTTLRSVADGRICGPCALARWLHVLDLTSIYPNPGVVTAVIARAAPLTATSPHLCAGSTNVCELTRSMPVLPSIDQWGPCAVAGRADPADRPVPHSADSNPAPVELSARPIVSRGRVAAVASIERPPAPPAPDKIALSRAGYPAITKPALEASGRRSTGDSPAVTTHLGLVRSNYSRADREQTGTPAAQLADGLEGRTLALLEHRAE